MVTHLKSASEASYDVISMATILRNSPLIKAIVCVGMVIFIQHERFFKHYINYFSRMMVLRHKAGQEGRGEILLENSFMR